MLTKKITFDIGKNIYERIEVKEGDMSSRTLEFHIKNGVSGYNLTNRNVNFYANKPDGTFVYNVVEIVDSIKGICKITLTNQTLAIPGILKSELVITEESKKLTSMVFDIEVFKCINNEASIESMDEFTILDELINKAHQYDREFAEMFSRLSDWSEEEKQNHLTWISNNRVEFNSILSELTSWSDEKKQEFILAINTWKSTRDSEFLDWQNDKKIEFSTWFQGIKDILSEEVATRLIGDVQDLKTVNTNIQNKILGLESDSNILSSKVSGLENNKAVVDEKLIGLNNLIMSMSDKPLYIEDSVTRDKYVWSIENGMISLTEVVN